MRRLLILLVISSIWLVSVASTPVVTGAKVRLKAKKYQETVKVLEDNKAKYPDDPELFYYLAMAYSGIAQWVKAGENFGLALQKNPKKGLRKDIDRWRDYHWTSFVKDASALLEQKRFPAAIAKFRIANAINPDRKESQANMGVALLEQAYLYSSGDSAKPDSAKLFFDESIAKFERAIELDPENDQFVKNLAQANLAAGNEEKAVEIYQDYLDNNPDDLQAQRRLVNIYMANKDFEKAAGIYDLMLEDVAAELGMSDIYNAGTCYYQVYFDYSKAEDEAGKEKSAEMLEKAGDCYSQVVEDDPTDCEAGTQLYYIYITQEKWEQVAEIIEGMLDNNCPRDYITLQNLGVSYIKMDQKKKAIEIFKEAETLKPKEGQEESN
ncbi:MAG: tetratricopeptide repeat protein [Gemmatimonadota bacterium]|nr:tetratricopeptide repeat protein [Gemmatimonadota bacterium]